MPGVNEIIHKIVSKHKASFVRGEELESIADSRIWYDTGSYTLNKLIHPAGRGMKGGKLIEIYGPAGSGKSLFLQLLIKSAQEQGGSGLIVDPEGAFEPDFATGIGLDLSKLGYVGPTREGDKELKPILRNEAMHIAEEVFIETQRTQGKDYPFVLGFDSLSALNVAKDLERNKADKNPTPDQGAKAKSLRQWVHRVRPYVDNTNFLWVFISHATATINRLGSGGSVATGGSASKFNSHVRVELSKGFQNNPVLIKGAGDIPVGEEFGIYISKNRVAPPYKRGKIQFYFREDGGLYLDKYSGYMDYLINKGAIIKPKSGSWLKYTDKAGKEHSFRSTEVDKLIEQFPEVLKV